MSTRVRIAVTMMAVALAAAACGADGGSADAVPPEARWLVDATEAPLGPNGWPLDAGTWVLDTFEEPLAFDVEDGLTVMSEEERVVYLGVDGLPHLVMIGEINGIWNGSADVPVPEVVAEIGDAFAASPAAEVIGEGVVGDATWWDIVVSEQTEQRYVCRLSEACAFAVLAGDDRIHVIDGGVMRVHVRPDLPVGLGVYVSGPAEGFDAAAEAAAAIVTSLRVADVSDRSAPTAQFIGAVGDGAPLQPNTVASIGSAVIRVEEVADDFTVVATGIDLVVLDHPQTSVLVARPSFVDLSGSSPETLRYLPSGVDPEAARTLLEASVEVLGESPVHVGDSDAFLFELGGPSSAALGCPETPINCAPLFAADGFLLGSVEGADVSERLYLLPDLDVVIAVAGFGISSDDAAAIVEPILDFVHGPN